MSYSSAPGHLVRGDLQVEHRHRRSVVGQHQRRRDPRRHLLQHGLRDRGDLRLGCGHVGSGLEEDLDDAAAVERLALDVLDVADRGGERALVVIDHSSRHVLRRQTVVGPDDRDHRNPDVRENIRRRAQRRASAENENQDRQHDERVRPLQGDEDDGVHSYARRDPSAPGQVPLMRRFVNASAERFK